MLHVEKEVVGADLNLLTVNELTYEEVGAIEPTVLPAHGQPDPYDYDVKTHNQKGRCVSCILRPRNLCVNIKYCCELQLLLQDWQCFGEFFKDTCSRK